MDLGFAFFLLQFGLGHLPVRRPARIWVAAADAVTEAFLDGLKVGRRPSELTPLPAPPGRQVVPLFERWQTTDVPEGYLGRSLAGDGVLDLVEGPPDPDAPDRLPAAEIALANGLSQAVRLALAVASGTMSLSGERKETPAESARKWLISNYPLLGALAAGMDLVEDPEACRALDITIAAVDPAERGVYLNPNARLHPDELRLCSPTSCSTPGSATIRGGRDGIRSCGTSPATT